MVALKAAAILKKKEQGKEEKCSNCQIKLYLADESLGSW